MKQSLLGFLYTFFFLSSCISQNSAAAQSVDLTKEHIQKTTSQAVSLSLFPSWSPEERLNELTFSATFNTSLTQAEMDTLYTAATEAFKEGRYAAAAAYFDQLPLDYKPYPAQWFRAASYARSGQEKKAIAILETSLLQAIISDKLTPAYHYLFHLLGSLLSTNEETSTGLWWLEHSQKFYSVFSEQGTKLYNDTDRSVRISYTHILYQAAMEALARKTCAPKEALWYLDKALTLSPNEPAHKGTYLDYDVLNLYKNAAEYIQNKMQSPEERQKINALGGIPSEAEPLINSAEQTSLVFQTLAIQELAVPWADGIVHNYLAEETLESYSQEFRIFARLYYFYSDSKLLIYNQIQELEAKISSLEAKTWDNYVEGASPEGRRAFYIPNVFSAGKALALAQWQARNTTDAMIFIYPMQGLPYIAVHAPPRLEYAPGLYGAPRFMIHLHDDAAKRHIALVHEFFHSVEFIFNPPRTSSQRPPLVPHVFQDGNEALRPSWYAGEAELRYYQLAFQNVVSSMNLQRLRLSAQSDNTREEAVAAAFP